MEAEARAGGVAVKTPLECPDQAPDQGHRVGGDSLEYARVAERGVEGIGEKCHQRDTDAVLKVGQPWCEHGARMIAAARRVNGDGERNWRAT